MSGLSPLTWKSGRLCRATPWKKIASSTADDERVADAAEHGVVGPDGQVVLAALGQPARVVGEVALRVVEVDPEALGNRGVHPPAPALDVLGRYERVGRGVVAVLVDQPDRVEHLHRVMGVEARNDLRDRSEVAIEELAQATAVVDRARARAAGDEQLEARDAERVLDVDRQQAEAERVRGGRADPVTLSPCRASRARSSYGTRQTVPTRLGSKCAGSGSSRTRPSCHEPHGAYHLRPFRYLNPM